MTPVGTGARISEQLLWRRCDDKSHEVNEGDLPFLAWSIPGAFRGTRTMRCVNVARQRRFHSPLCPRKTQTRFTSSGKPLAREPCTERGGHAQRREPAQPAQRPVRAEIAHGGAFRTQQDQ
jgi:hypothetical protein